MELSLDHQQRLNLIALIGAQKANVADMRMWWKLQDQFELNEEEKNAISYRMEMMQNMEVPVWDPKKKLDPRSFELSEGDAVRIKRAIEEWPAFVTANDRIWLAPLLTQLDQVSTNGQPKP